MTKRPTLGSDTNDNGDSPTSTSSANKETGIGDVEIAQVVDGTVLIGELDVKHPTQTDIRNDVKKKVNEAFRQIKTLTNLDKSDAQGSLETYEISMGFFSAFVYVFNMVLAPTAPQLALLSDGRAANLIRERISNSPRVLDYLLKSIAPTVKPVATAVSTKTALIEVHPTSLITDSFTATILYHPTSNSSVGLTIATNLSNTYGLPDLHVGMPTGFPMFVVCQKLLINGLPILSYINTTEPFSSYCDPAVVGHTPYFILNFTKKMIKTEIPQTSTVNASAMFRFA